MYKNKAIIGVMPLYDEDKESYWMLPAYMQALEERGAIPLMLPLTNNAEELDYFIDCCDGFLLTGGQDVNPAVYEQAKSSACGVPSDLRDGMDEYILKNAVDIDKAVLGICRGIQIMNAVYGGTLYQDLPLEYGSKIEHHMEPPYNRGVHSVELMENTPIKKLLQANTICVNSYHHQAVKAIAPNFEKMAISEDGIIEGIYMPNKKFVWGVQWHPELSYKSCEYSSKIFDKFLNTAK